MSRRMKIQMAEGLLVRTSASADLAAIEALYPEAFPEEDLLPLVRELLGETAMAQSLVSVVEGRIVGHAAFTRCGDLGDGLKTSLLGPVAVAPLCQRRGVGGRMICSGFQRLEEEGVDRVFVLGDPAYYGRFGFQADASVEPPYPLPAEWVGAWQSKPLSGSVQTCAGTLSVPAPWRHPELWAD